VLDADSAVLLRVVSTGIEDEHDGRQVLGQCLVVIDHLSRIAVPFEKDAIWATHHLHSAALGRDIGLLRVGLRFRLPHELDTSVTRIRDRSVFFEAELVTETLFQKYDTNGDGYLTRKEFLSFITELTAVGGNIRQLEEANDGTGCLGFCLPLPTMDLFSYIKHNHTLLVICFDRTRFLRKHVRSSLMGRLGFVLMSLLWSLSVNCLVEIYMNTSRFWQVLTICLVDNTGKSVLNVFFLVVHLRCWGRLCPSGPSHEALSHEALSVDGAHAPSRTDARPGCELGSLVIFIVFLGFFSTWLLLTMSPEQLYNSSTSFIPIWSFSRFTEIFFWGTFWAFLVQFGSSDSAKKTVQGQRARERARASERRRRARLMGEERPWWQPEWLWRGRLVGFT